MVWPMHLPGEAARHSESNSCADFLPQLSSVRCQGIYSSLRTPEFLLQLAEQYGDNVRFLKVDTEEEYELAQQMKVRVF